MPNSELFRIWKAFFERILIDMLSVFWSLKLLNTVDSGYLEVHMTVNTSNFWDKKSKINRNTFKMITELQRKKNRLSRNFDSADFDTTRFNCILMVHNIMSKIPLIIKEGWKNSSCDI